MKTAMDRTFTAPRLIVASAFLGFLHGAACCALQPAISPLANCNAVPGLDALLRTRDGLLLGEMHGTAESPAFADCTVHLALAAGRSVTFAIEMPSEEESRIRTFLGSAGSASDRGALLSGDFWRAPFQDGRRSQAMLDLLEDVRRLTRAGAAVRLVLLDSTGFAGPARDRGMADRLAAAAAAPHDLLVALTGNLHTRIRKGAPWDPAYEPMGHLLTQLAPKLQLTALDVAYSGGTAWYCATPQPESCGAKPVKGRPEATSTGVTIFPAVDADGYGGVYTVGALTASPPAVR